MIKIENVEICGWEPTIRGMRNPLNSWVKSDSGWDEHVPSLALRDKVNWDEYAKKYEIVEYDDEREFAIGPNDKGLMERLAKGGPAHAKYRRFITVYLDILAPLYWWKEFETYKVGTDSNSCSTMHKIAAKEFTLDDFSHEHLEEASERQLYSVILLMNYWRTVYLNGGMVDGLTEDGCPIVWDKKDKRAWWQMIQLLPSSYNQRRTIKLNYETLYRIYHDRKGHKLDEWNEFCAWIESLPLSEVITGPSLKDIPIANEIMEEAKRRVYEELEMKKADPFDKWKDIPKEVIEKLSNNPNGYKIPARYLCNLCDYNNLDDPTNEETCKRRDHYEYSKWAKIEHLIDISSPESDHPHYTIAAGAHESDLTEYEKELLKKV